MRSAYLTGGEALVRLALPRTSILASSRSCGGPGVLDICGRDLWIWAFRSSESPEREALARASRGSTRRYATGGLT